MTTQATTNAQQPSFHQAALEMYKVIEPNDFHPELLNLVKCEVVLEKDFLSRVVEFPKEALILLVQDVYALFQYYILGIDDSTKARVAHYKFECLNSGNDGEKRLELMGLIAMAHLEDKVDVRPTLNYLKDRLPEDERTALETAGFNPETANVDVLTYMQTHIKFLRRCLKEAEKQKNWTKYLRCIQLFDQINTAFGPIPNPVELKNIWSRLPQEIQSLERKCLDCILGTFQLADVVEAAKLCLDFLPTFQLERLTSLNATVDNDADRLNHMLGPITHNQHNSYEAPNTLGYLEVEGEVTPAELGKAYLEEFLRFAPENQEVFLDAAIHRAEAIDDHLNPFKKNGIPLSRDKQMLTFQLGIATLFVTERPFSALRVCVQEALTTTNIN